VCAMRAKVVARGGQGKEDRVMDEIGKRLLWRADASDDLFGVAPGILLPLPARNLIMTRVGFGAGFRNYESPGNRPKFGPPPDTPANTALTAECRVSAGSGPNSRNS
jgi:hypothetical protein